jgi:lipopolysaccharide/colanic/teichoic acid biosynthesis glycosyltransferase
MDELPQLLNIFLGDMSFVGPRALLPNEVEVHGSARDVTREEELFRKRCEVTPGLTGIAQIFAPRDVPRIRKFRYDLFYIRRRSFLFDLKLIFLSFYITLRGKWESRGDKITK